MKLIGPITALIILAASVQCFALVTRLSVPPSTVSVTVVQATVDSSGKVTNTTTNSFCPAGSTITVTQPNDTGSYSYVSVVSFSDGNGNSLSTVEIFGGGVGGGGAPKN